MSDLHLHARKPRDEARERRDRFYETSTRDTASGVRALLCPLRARTEYTYTVRFRERSCRRDGIVKASTAVRMTTAAPSGCIVRNPERGSSAHGGKLDATQLVDRRGNGCERGGLRAKHFAAAGAYGGGEERPGAVERRSRTRRLAVDQPNPRRESLFAVDRHQCGQREKS